MTLTMTMTFREHTQRAILETCDLQDTDYISDNWEQQSQHSQWPLNIRVTGTAFAILAMFHILYCSSNPHCHRPCCRPLYPRHPFYFCLISFIADQIHIAIDHVAVLFILAPPSTFCNPSSPHRSPPHWDYRILDWKGSMIEMKRTEYGQISGPCNKI